MLNIKAPPAVLKAHDRISRFPSDGAHMALTERSRLARPTNSTDLLAAARDSSIISKCIDADRPLGSPYAETRVRDADPLRRYRFDSCAQQGRSGQISPTIRGKHRCIYVSETFGCPGARSGLNNSANETLVEKEQTRRGCVLKGQGRQDRFWGGSIVQADMRHCWLHLNRSQLPSCLSWDRTGVRSYTARSWLRLVATPPAKQHHRMVRQQPRDSDGRSS